MSDERHAVTLVMNRRVDKVLLRVTVPVLFEK